MKKYFLFVLLVMSLPTIAKNKHRNSIKLYGSNFIYPEFHNKQQIKQIIGRTPYVFEWMQVGASYERVVYKKMSITIGYHKWNTTGYFNPTQADRRYLHFTNIIDVGLLARQDLKFTDLSATYTVFATKKHMIKAGLGISFQKGYSWYVDSIYDYVNASFPHYEVYSHIEYKEYWGYVPAISYDYFFLKKWACTGVDVRMRKYFNYDYTQVEFGIHLGVNF